MTSPTRYLSYNKKCALIIANGDYHRPENKLPDSIRNAQQLSVSLEEIGFSVMKYVDVKKEDDMMEIVKTFVKDIKRDDLVLFYFTGHACQTGDKNYLIPTEDSKIDGDQNFQPYATDMQRVLERLTDPGKLHKTVLILDCCRPYVLNKPSSPTINDHGLREIRKDAATEVYIQFSCASNQTANDDLFFKYLLQNIGQEDENIQDVFQSIADLMHQENNTRPRPWYINTLSNARSVCLNPTSHRKLALIIANEKYNRSDYRLRRFIRNAKNLEGELDKIGFEITMKKNVPAAIMGVIKDFAETVQRGDLVLAYFCGLSCHVEDKNYLLPVGDDRIETDINFEDNANDAQRILDRLLKRKPLCCILILDCCIPYLLRSDSTPNVIVKGNGLVRMTAPPETFIQFSCAANRTVDDRLFIKYLLKIITLKNVDVSTVFRHVAEKVYSGRDERQRPLSINGLSNDKPVYLNKVESSLPDIPFDSIWRSNAQTIAGDRCPDSAMHRLHSPQGLSISTGQNLLIADSMNHRIMKYNLSTGTIQRILGKNIQGYGPDLLARPSSVIYDHRSKSYIICDYHNLRLLQMFRRKQTYTKILKENIACFGLAMDEKGCLYVSDTERHEVIRYQPGKKYGKVVAGGHGQGSRHKQLNHPTYICIGDNQTVYVSDSWNDRVMKWDKGATQGKCVAGGKGKGRDRTQLDCPAGVLIDRQGTLYVADHGNDRVMRYREKQEPDIIAGDRFLPGSDRNHLISPDGLAFDQDDNLYVADSNNHRIQRFQIQKP